MPRLLVCAVLFAASLNSFAQQRAQIAKALDGDVSPDEFVVLITGACETKPGEFAVRDCVRGVTRQEFEQLLTVVPPNTPPQKLAEVLGEVIILSNEAKKRGLPKDPTVQQALKFNQMQALATLLVSQSLKKEADAVPPAEIEAYYNSHLSDYQAGEFQKITIPQAVSANVEERAKIAEDLRARCAAGEDPSKLQAEVDAKANRMPVKLTELKNQHKNFYPVAEQRIFDLKPGQCSALFPERNDLVLFKAIAFTTTPLADVKDAIVKVLEANRLKDELAAIKKQNVVSLNNKYFVVPSQPPAPTTPKK